VNRRQCVSSIKIKVHKVWKRHLDVGNPTENYWQKLAAQCSRLLRYCNIIDDWVHRRTRCEPHAALDSAFLIYFKKKGCKREEPTTFSVAPTDQYPASFVSIVFSWKLRKGSLTTKSWKLFIVEILHCLMRCPEKYICNQMFPLLCKKRQPEEVTSNSLPEFRVSRICCQRINLGNSRLICKTPVFKYGNGCLHSY